MGSGHLPGNPSTAPLGRVPAHERPNLEYGASAVFPCGVVPATDLQGRAPALVPLPNYVLRVFVENGRSISCWFRLDIDLCGNVAATIGRRFRPHGKTAEAPYSRLRPANGQRQLAGERVPSAMGLRTPHFAACFGDFASL